MKRLLLIVVLFSVVIVMRNFAYAESTAGQVKDSPGKEMSKDCPQDKMDNSQVENLMKQLSLTDDQKKQITDIMKAEKAKIEQLQNKMEDYRNDLMRVSFSPQYNEAQSNSIIVDKLSPLFKEEMTYYVQMMRESNAKLTALQQEQIQKLIPRNKPHNSGSRFMNFDFTNYNW